MTKNILHWYLFSIVVVFKPYETKIATMETTQNIHGNDSRIMTVPDVYALQHFYLKLWLGWNWQVQESGE